MDGISKLIRHLISPFIYESKKAGYAYFYLRARELGFDHERIRKTMNNIK